MITSTTSPTDKAIGRSKKLSAQIKTAAIRIAVIAFWIAVWHVISVVVDKEILLPSPIDAIRRLIELAATPVYWSTSLSSLVRITGGFFAACAVGTLLSVGMNRSKLLRFLFSPLLAVVKVTPVASFILLAIIWIKGSYLPGFMSFMMVLPIICGNLSEGLEQVDRRLLSMARVFKFGRMKTLRMIYIPSVLPYFMAVFKTGLGLSWKAGIAAEVIAVTTDSIGKMLHNSKIYIETVDLFAWTFTVMLLSGLLELIFVRLANSLYRRYLHTPNEQAGGDAE
jgi:NitT/TauT family transport system permease protein